MRFRERASLISLLAAMAAVLLISGGLGFDKFAGERPIAGRDVHAQAGGDLSDLTASAEKILAGLPGVEKVEVLVASDRPTHRIIHIADWHFVPRAAFAADLRDQAEDPISDAEIDTLYAEHLDEVRRVQSTQRRLLTELIAFHGLCEVFCEGLTDSDMPIYQVMIEHFRRRGSDEPALAGGDDHIDETLLRIGATGQLLVAGELAGVLPVEDEATYERADPLAGSEGELVFAGRANDERQAAIVRRLLANGPLAVVVLGCRHDLSQQIRQLSGGRCEYIRVRVTGLPVADQTAN